MLLDSHDDEADESALMLTIKSKFEKPATTMEKQNWLFQYAAIGQNPSQTTKLSSKSQLGPLKIEETTVQWVGLFI